MPTSSPCSYLLICVLVLHLSWCQSFSEYKQQMQQLVMYVAGNMSLHYQDWCSGGVATCETPSFNACLGGQQKVCDNNFPKPVMCLNQGQYISNSSSIKFPQNIDYNNLSAQDIRFVCSSAKLQTTFHYVSRKRNKKFTSMYIGNNRGLFRQLPGDYRGSDGKCDEYDPRSRPWYTIAASGTKNIIILIDKSSSMNKYNQLENAKIAVNSVIDTLSITDNIGVIAFENSTEVIGNPKMTKATNEYKEELKLYVSHIKSYDGETNYQNPFRTGLDMISTAIERGDIGCSQAENVFLLITDGNPTQNLLTANKLITFINGYMGQKPLQFRRKIILFSYAMGAQVNIQFLKELSCSFRGIVIQPSLSSTSTSSLSSSSLSSSSSSSSQSSISSSSPLSSSSSYSSVSSTSAIVTQLQQFYKYLAVGVHFTTPIWTQPYNDYYGYGQMVTVSMPAYYLDKQTNLTMLLGVAGVDIIMQQFNKYGYSQQDIIIKLIGQSACQKNQLTDCQLQRLRSQKLQCSNISNCQIIINNSTVCHNIPHTQSIWRRQKVSTDLSRCCGLTITSFIIIVCVTIGVLLLVLLLVLCRKNIWKALCDRTYKKVRTNSNSGSGKQKHQTKQSTSTENQNNAQSRRKQSLQSQQTLKMAKQNM